MNRKMLGKLMPFNPPLFKDWLESKITQIDALLIAEEIAHGTETIAHLPLKQVHHAFDVR
jgi:hypothetical protein